MRHILPTVITFKSACTGYVRLSFDSAAFDSAATGAGGEQYKSASRIDMNNKDVKKITT